MKLFLEKISTGASDDLAKATDLARSMVSQFGMSDKLGMVSVESRPMQWLNSPLESRRGTVSETTASVIDGEIRRILDEAFVMASESLIRHRKFIEDAHKVLMESETLSELEILDIWQSSKVNVSVRSESTFNH